jgi:hypothetical protein
MRLVTAMSIPQRHSELTDHASRVNRAGTSDHPRAYGRACRLAVRGRYEQARRLYASLSRKGMESRLQALITSDLASLAAIEGRLDEAREGWRTALELDTGCLPARLNGDFAQGIADHVGPDASHALRPGAARPDIPARPEPRPPDSDGRSTKVALLSFLFNWPSTGGGNIHTVELARFLGRAGFDVRHIHARYPEWGIGGAQQTLPITSEVLEFDSASWRLDEIQARYRQAVDSFDADYVIITDAWNMKPLLAEAVEGYPYFLRFQAQECLCPLNNLRLLASSSENVEQCPKNQLASPGICHRCLVQRRLQSGSLHQWERELCRVGTPDYDRKLRRALEEAEAILVLNPLIGSLLEPYARRVCVVPWGMDPARFPWPLGEEVGTGRPAVGREGGVGRPAPSNRPTPNVRPDEANCGTAFQAVDPHGRMPVPLTAFRSHG